MSVADGDHPQLATLADHTVKTLRRTYNESGLEVFDVDARGAFQAIGSIIARVCGRERLYDAMAALDLAVDIEGIDGPLSNSSP